MAFLDSDELEDVPAVVPGEILPGLSGHIRQKFIAAEEGRHSDEERWLQAYEAGVAPKVRLEATHEKALDIIPLSLLEEYAAD